MQRSASRSRLSRSSSVTTRRLFSASLHIALVLVLVLIAGCRLHGAPETSCLHRWDINIQDNRLSAILQQTGYDGVIALREGTEIETRCSDLALCDAREIPASTFKIVNAMIALENGVATSPEMVIPWDGVTRPIEAWNRDHTLRSAMQVSAVPYYQELARRIGLQRMQDGIDRYDYGNRDIGHEVDRFWLDGPLAISPREQLDFLRRFTLHQLPISTYTQAVMEDILILDRSDGVLRGKTGWGRVDSPEEFGWFVGYLEKEYGSVRYVAVLIRRGPHSTEEFQQARRVIAERALREH